MKKNSLPLISVIIPYYNPVPEYFKDAIYSVLSQSYTNWEVIIVNDGSSEESKIFLENFINSLNEKRISIIHLDKNFGVPTAKNKGIEFSNGEIITFLDQDDLHLPWYYKKIVNYFFERPNCRILAFPDLCYFSFSQVKKAILRILMPTLDIENISLDESNLIKAKVLSCSPRLVVKKEVFKKLSFDPEIITAEDIEFCLQINE